MYRIVHSIPNTPRLFINQTIIISYHNINITHFRISYMESLDSLLLKDPNNTRRVPQFRLPYQGPLPDDFLFSNGNKIDWNMLKNFLKRQGRISKASFNKLIQISMNIMKIEPNLLRLQDPINIIGDIHGQFYDFCKLLQSEELIGSPEGKKFLFLGDYVDRGSFSIQVITLLLALKVTYPDRIFLLRGNHQCQILTSHFNFRKEAIQKFDAEIYSNILSLFNTLPLAAIVNNQYLCVHGGISHNLKELEDINRIDRFKEIPKNGLFCDLLWSDPVPNKTGDCDNGLVLVNQERGCSYYYGSVLTKSFLSKYNLKKIIRAHQNQDEGYKAISWDGKESKSIQNSIVLTIFSAPNYCDFYENLGAILKIKNNTLAIKTYAKAPHPFLLGNFLDLFSWSIPFIIQKTTQMFFHIIKPNEENKEKLLKVEEIQEYQEPAKLVYNFIQQLKVKNKRKMETLALGFDDKLLENEKATSSIQADFQTKKRIDILNQSLPAN